MTAGSAGVPERARIAALIERYRAHAGCPPAFVVRAPGRVNLIGEHTDYNGLPVLPMAIDRSTLVAGIPSASSMVRLTNADPRFTERLFRLAPDIPTLPSGDWGNYAQAAAQGLVRHLGPRVTRGADLLVDGNIPTGAGLSSSAALVVATGLALLAANDLAVPGQTLAEVLAAAERYVGTMSGGMDQAACLLAEATRALRIDFFPLRTRAVPVPLGYDIVVCHSLVEAAKAGAAQAAYNLRVTECRLATRILAAVLGRPLERLGDLAPPVPGRRLADYLPALAARIPDAPLTLAEIASLLGTSAQNLWASRAVSAGPGDRFSPLRRARHVLTEADRVDAAEAALACGDAEGFGALMNASHASCRDDYEISCPALETLVTTAREAGAIGCRLTGAGFGGCVVCLVPAGHVVEFLACVDTAFYRPRLGGAAATDGWRFVFTPQAGACVLRD